MVALLAGAYTIGFAEIVTVSFALSIGSNLDRTNLLASLVAILVLAVACSGRTRFPSVQRSARALHDVLRDPLVAFAAIVVWAVVSYSFALAVFTPENERDALGYHLTRAALWRQQEGIGRIHGAMDATLNDYPGHGEIAQMYTMVIAGSGRYAGLVQLAAFLALGLAVFGIARRIGFGPRAALFGSLLLCTTPAVALQASTSLTDVVVASLVACATFFLLGQTRRNLLLASLAVALLVGTKLTGLLALPVLVTLALADRKQRLEALAAVGIGVAVGSYWYIANLIREGDLFGSVASEHVPLDGIAAVARIGRLALDAIELPGAPGLDRLLYVVASALVASLILIRSSPPRRIARALVGAGAVLMPLVAVEFGRLLLRGYLKAFDLLGRPDLYLDPSRSATKASPIFSWYGGIGVLLTITSGVLIVGAVRRQRAPRVALVLVAAPAVWIVLLGIAIPYFEWNGRFAMAGFALAATTWGSVYQFRNVAWAAVAVAALTASLSFVHLHEKKAGIRTLEPAEKPSIWSEPAWRVQGSEIHQRALLRFAEHGIPPDARLAVYPEHWPGGGDPLGDIEPFPFFGENLSRTILFASTPREATRVGAQWAIVHRRQECLPKWKRAFVYDGWMVLRRVRRSRCITQ